MLWFRFVRDPAQPRYMPNALQGVLLLWIFYRVRASETLILSFRRPHFPTPTLPWESSKTLWLTVLKYYAKSVLWSWANIIKTWIAMREDMADRFENKWGMLWIWLKEKRILHHLKIRLGNKFSFLPCPGSWVLCFLPNPKLEFPSKHFSSLKLCYKWALIAFKEITVFQIN